MKTEHEEAAELAIKSALGHLWALDAKFDEIRQFEGRDAATAHWLLYSHDCKRWIAVVSAAGRTRELPPDLLRKRAIFNLKDWRIP